MTTKVEWSDKVRFRIQREVSEVASYRVFSTNDIVTEALGRLTENDLREGVMSIKTATPDVTPTHPLTEAGLKDVAAFNYPYRQVYPEPRQQFRLLQLAAKAILEHPHVHKWSIQGLGMFRMYLSERVRLHVWNSDFAQPKASRLHDHPWGFRSTVIVGAIKNQIFEEIDEDSTSPLAQTFMKQTLRCGVGCQLIGEPKPTHLKTATIENIGPGMVYTQRPIDIHDTAAQQGTVTLVERDFGTDRDHATVLWPYGGDWVSAEPREASWDEIESMAAQTLAAHFMDLV